MSVNKLRNIAFATARRAITEQNLDMEVSDLAEKILLRIEEKENDELRKKEYINKEFKDKFSKKKNKTVKMYSKFDEEFDKESNIAEALIKKSESSGISLDVIAEVYDRGYSSWDDDSNIDPNQHAFARVNSYINKGKTYYGEDSDLQELSKDTLRSYENAAYKDKMKTFKDRRVAGISRVRKRERGQALANKKLATEALDSQAEKIRKLNRNFRDRKRASDKRLENNKRASLQNKDIKENEDVSRNNRIGTESLLKKYLRDTPGQKKPNIKEAATSSDKVAVLVPAHKDGNGNDIPAKTHWKKSSRKILRNSGNNSDGKPNK